MDFTVRLHLVFEFHIKPLFLVVVRTPCSLVQMRLFAGEPSARIWCSEDGDRTSREKNPGLG